jgi:dTDP-4-amino-4,6-dideoxygalactose transaminase
VDVGSSFLPSELIGAFLWGQIEEAETIIANRRASFDRYLHALRPLQDAGCLRLPQVPEGLANGHIFYILTESLAVREALTAALKEDDISAVFHYVPLHASPAGRRFGRAVGELPVTLATADRLLRLPLYFGMRPDEVDRVVDRIFAFSASPGRPESWPGILRWRPRLGPLCEPFGKRPCASCGVCPWSGSCGATAWSACRKTPSATVSICS